MSEDLLVTKEEATNFVKNLSFSKNNELSHHGIKGMKWGIRRRSSASSSGGKASGSTKEKAAPKKVKESKRKPPTTKVPNTFKNSPKNRRMSDAELRNRLNRLQMEKQYKELTAPSKQTRTFFQNLMIETGQRTAKQVANRAADAALGMALDKLAGSVTNPANKAFFEAMANAGGKKKN